MRFRCSVFHSLEVIDAQWLNPWGLDYVSTLRYIDYHIVLQLILCISICHANPLSLTSILPHHVNANQMIHLQYKRINQVSYETFPFSTCDKNAEHLTSSYFSNKQNVTLSPQIRHGACDTRIGFFERH